MAGAGNTWPKRRGGDGLCHPFLYWRRRWSQALPEVAAGRRGHHQNKRKERRFWLDGAKNSPWGQLGTGPGLREVSGSLSLEVVTNQLDKAPHKVSSEFTLPRAGGWTETSRAQPSPSDPVLRLPLPDAVFPRAGLPRLALTYFFTPDTEAQSSLEGCSQQLGAGGCQTGAAHGCAVPAERPGSGLGEPRPSRRGQVARGHFGYLRGWSLLNLTGQRAPVDNRPCSKKRFSYV